MLGMTPTALAVGVWENWVQFEHDGHAVGWPSRGGGQGGVAAGGAGLHIARLAMGG